MAVRVDDPQRRGTAKTTPQGISAISYGADRGVTDILRGFLNGASDVGDFFASRPAGTSNIGDKIYGAPPEAPVVRPKRGMASHVPGDKPMDFSDYLALAQQYMQESGAGAPDYSAIENALQQKALQSDAKLQAMYRQLHGSIDADAPTIAGQYDQAQAAIGQNADQAAGNVNAAYDASRDAQTQQLAALGIQDAASVLAANGGNAAADQAHAVGNIEQNRQTGQNQTTLNKASALDYNTNIGNASSLAGSEARGSIQQQLMDALSQIALKKSEAQQQSGSGALDLAMQLQDRAGAQNGSSQDQQALAEFLYRQQNDQSNRSADLWQTLLRLYDGDTQKAAQAYAQSQASGLA